jgi:hypothetical protein
VGDRVKLDGASVVTEKPVPVVVAATEPFTPPALPELNSV